MRTVLLVLAVTGCVTKSEKLAYFDDDADGFHTPFGEDWGGVPPWDCDDEDATSFPGGTEVCDGVDNDCNAVIDDGDDRVTVFADGDDDGYGDDDESKLACGEGTDWVLVGGDCNDGNDSVSPGAREECNDVDDDCDGTTDKGSALATEPYYRDEDGDEFGLNTDVTYACERPSGYADVNGDCNDADARIFPGATETCDAVDNDCDLQLNEGLPATDWYVDEDGDGYGVGAPFSLCNQPTGMVATNGDCDDTTDLVSPDLVETCNDGLDNDCDSSVAQCQWPASLVLADADSSVLGSPSDRVGIAAASGDLDGDGVDDLAVLTEGSSTVAIWFGGAGFDLTSAPSVTIVGSVGTYSRPLATCVGDVTGDAVDDLVIGWGVTGTVATPTFAVYAGPLSSSTTTSTSRTVSSPSYTTGSELIVSCGDVHGTATPDLFLSRGTDRAVFDGPIAGPLSLSTPSVLLSGPDWYPLDADSDTTVDLLQFVGASALELSYGPYAVVSTDAYFTGANLGRQGSAGDIDQDGYPELFLSDFGATLNGAFAMYDGGASRWTGTVAAADRRIFAPTAGVIKATHVEVVGDIDADGFLDVYIGGAPDGASITSDSWSWLISGRTLGSGDVTLPGAALSAFNVGTVSTPIHAGVVSGDFNGDDVDDVILLTPFGTSSSGAYSFLGRGI